MPITSPHRRSVFLSAFQALIPAVCCLRTWFQIFGIRYVRNRPIMDQMALVIGPALVHRSFCTISFCTIFTWSDQLFKLFSLHSPRLRQRPSQVTAFQLILQVCLSKKHFMTISIVHPWGYCQLKAFRVRQIYYSWCSAACPDMDYWFVKNWYTLLFL